MRKFILIASMLAVAGFVACSSDESDDGAAGAAGTGGATGGTGGATGGTGGGSSGEAGTGGGETGGTGGATGGTGGGETGGTGGGETGGTGGGSAGEAGSAGQAGGAGEAGSAGAAGTGGGGGQDCTTCGQTNCPDEVTACLGATGCLECLQGDDASCNADNEDEVNALGECLMTNCEDECMGGGGVDCDAPAVAASAGSCITIGGNNTCNPVTNEGCDTAAGEACDANQGGGYECYPAPNTQAMCEECSDTVGYCQGGMVCIGECGRFCCDDTDCSATGTCDKTIGLPGGVGVCLAK
jgi:hypothetical protein